MAIEIGDQGGCIVDSTVYWLSDDGIRRLDGVMPVRISEFCLPNQQAVSGGRLELGEEALFELSFEGQASPQARFRRQRSPRVLHSVLSVGREGFFAAWKWVARLIVLGAVDPERQD